MNGVFISYRHEYGLLGGYIYTFLMRRGYDPFIDEEFLGNHVLWSEIEQKIREAPYFISVLARSALSDFTNEALKGLSERQKQKLPSYWIFKELLFAASIDKDIIFISPSDYKLPDDLPELVFSDGSTKAIREYRFVTLDLQDVSEMEFKLNKLCLRNLREVKIRETVSWWNRLENRGTQTVLSRGKMHRLYATLEARFGRELTETARRNAEAAKAGRERQSMPESWHSPVSFVKMSCFSAQFIFYENKEDHDHQAVQLGLMAEIFRLLIESDSNFQLHIILTDPGSLAAREAISSAKLGNRRLIDDQMRIFLSPVEKLTRLIEEDPVFKDAYEHKRFRFSLTGEFMTESIFITEYYDRDEEKRFQDHVKVEYYDPGIKSAEDRRCVVFFAEGPEDHRVNFGFYSDLFDRYERLSRPALEARAGARELACVRGTDIAEALEKTERQYLTGHLSRAQLIRHIDDDTEIGISYYKEYTREEPHYHTVTMEHSYILSGEIRTMILDGSGRYEEYREGDLFVIPPMTPYATKARAGTRILFIKSPGINDKVRVDADPRLDHWLSGWDEEY